ncbi:hypothetical protein GPUN_1687 [Glaciecola punicea ACAM 611]|uniref:Uncharacterized protein n=2 Tax=Glaciecola TaxID=89404 RepID=H5TBX6_9ALTE|nr:hypothetical protein GPUN_1687 [Glaciecola punicea ACAM 611]
MRVFSDFEKKIIRELIAGFEKENYLNCFDNLLAQKPNLQPMGYYLTNVKLSKATKSRVNIYVDMVILEKDSCSSITSFLIELLELFEYLQENQLITIVPLSTSDGESALGIEKNAQAIKVDCLPDIFLERIFSFTTAELFPSQRLINHVNNNYKTSQDLKHEKEINTLSEQLNHTKKAFWLSFGGLILSLFVSISAVAVDLWGKTTIKVEEMPASQTPDRLVEISKSLDKIAIKQNHIAQNLKEISAEQKKASENFEKPNPSYRASETKTDRNESF